MLRDVVIDYIYGEIHIIFALIHFSEEKCCNCCNLGVVV